MANTTIGSSIVIDGEISGEEDLVVQGTVKGKIVLKQNLLVEKTGVVEADVHTSNVTISGQVTGNVTRINLAPVLNSISIPFGRQ